MLWIIGLAIALSPLMSLSNFIFVLFRISFVPLLASWVALAIEKNWWRFAISIISSTAITTGILLLFTFIYLYFPVPDYFGRNHPIPEGTEYNIPFDMESETAADINEILSTGDLLQIWSRIQGGIYLYDFYYEALPAEEIFLKCYEITENIPLSPERIRQKSTVTIQETSSFSQLAHKQKFTIYEGDWGYHYAARIEVWYKNAATLQESKLYEKIYRVEGWQR